MNHAGGLFGIGPYQGKQQERFHRWKGNMRALSDCSHVVVKLGGLGMPTTGLCDFPGTDAPGSEQLAEAWRPYLETCIELFGASRCMFESNFPVDAATTYPVI